MNKKYLKFVLPILGVISLIHLFAISLKSKIKSIIINVKTAESDVLYSSLVLENYGYLTNIILIGSAFIFAITFLFTKYHKIKYKYLISFVFTLVFLIVELMFYKSYF